MSRIAASPLVIAALVHCGCGDPVRDARYAGQPIVLLDGVVDQGSGSLSPVPPGTHVALFWQTDTGWIQSAHPGQPVVDGSGWRIPIYRVPPAEARTAGFAVGRVMPFDDLDGDGRRGPSDPFLARRQEATIYWSATGIDPDTAPITHPLPAGFHKVVGPVPCDGPWPLGDMDCGDDFGAACDTGCDSDAICVSASFAILIDRRCLFEADRCAPIGGRLVPIYTPRGASNLWVPACEVDADCDGDKICSAASGTCVSGNQVGRIGVTASPTTPTVCSSLDG